MAISEILLLLDNAKPKSSQPFSYLDFISSQILLKWPLDEKHTLTHQIATQSRYPSYEPHHLSLSFMVVFVILCIAIENEFATAHRFENIIKKFNLVDFVYQKCKGIQAYERAERRSVTATLNITPEQKLLLSTPLR